MTLEAYKELERKYAELQLRYRTRLHEVAEAEQKAKKWEQDRNDFAAALVVVRSELETTKQRLASADASLLAAQEKIRTLAANCNGYHRRAREAEEELAKMKEGET